MKRYLLVLASLIVALSFMIESDKEKTEAQFAKISAVVKAEFAPDRRLKTFEPSLFISSTGDTLVLKGSTTEAAAKKALISKLSEAGLNVLDSMVLLPDPAMGGKTYGITNQSVINFRYSPTYSAESATQTVLGTPVRILEKKNGWTRAITPEGYIAWVSNGSIAPMTEQEFNSWRDAKKLVITTHYTLLRSAASEKSQVVMDGVWGNIVKYVASSGKYYKVALPDGREAFLLKKYATDFKEWINSRNPTPENIVATAKQFIGFPYMWGGTSIKAMDCSGFTKTSFYLNGIILERDASQQALTGEDVDISKGFDNLKTGDLLFFGSKATADKKERISHVGMYIKDGEFIHSATSVRINSLIPSAWNYYDGSTRLVRARRILTKVDMDSDIVSIKNHPWYFAK